MGPAPSGRAVGISNPSVWQVRSLPGSPSLITKHNGTQSQSIKELDKSLAFLIEGTTEKGGKLVDWLYEQAPEIVTQLLVWKGIESLINFILGIILIVVPSLLLIKFIPKLKDSIYKFNIKEMISLLFLLFYL